MARRSLPKICSLSAPTAAVIIFVAAALDPTRAQQTTTPPTNLVATEDIVLQTITPLGEASVVVPKGSALTNVEVQGTQARIWQGPFSAMVSLAAVQPTQPADVPSPAPTVEPVSRTPEPTPAPSATPLPAPSLSAMAETGLEKLPPWALPAACGALVLYALFSTIGWLRARRSSTPAAKFPSQTPVVIMPKDTKAKPAVLSDGGRAIACPHCGANIPLEKLSPGRNTCPSCRQRFVCE